jgi:methylase of polypeptide subunit release factors
VGSLQEREDLTLPAGVGALREQLLAAGYTTERIEQTIGGGRLSFSPADVAVHVRRLRGADEPFAALAKLFLLGLTLDAVEASAVLDIAEGWLEPHRDGVRAAVKLVPHGDLLIASDRDADGPTGADWVAGMHPPSVTLAKLTVRRPVERVLDVGTGNGVQALLASRHAETVVATDVNRRALAFAELNARLNGVSNIEHRHGSYFEAADGERFDLVTCNPPYVISPESSYAYRDSGLPGDAVSREVVQAVPDHLAEDGFAHILVSWAHEPGDWSTPLQRWVEGRGCDALLLYFGSDDPITHASEWLRPVARDDPAHYADSLDRWLGYLDDLGIEAIAHGAVILRRRSGAPNWTHTERVSLDGLEQAGEHVLRVFAAQDHLRALDDERALLDERFELTESHEIEHTLAYVDGKAELRGTVLSLTDGLASRTALDRHTAELLALLDGRRTLRETLAEQARALGLDAADTGAFQEAALPVVRRLLELGALLPLGVREPASYRP